MIRRGASTELAEAVTAFAGRLYIDHLDPKPAERLEDLSSWRLRDWNGRTRGWPSAALPAPKGTITRMVWRAKYQQPGSPLDEVTARMRSLELAETPARSISTIAIDTVLGSERRSVTAGPPADIRKIIPMTHPDPEPGDRPTYIKAAIAKTVYVV